MTSLDSKIAGSIYPIGGAVVDDKGELVTTGDKDSHYVPEALSFQNYVKDYLNGEGKTLLDYLSNVKGKRMVKIKGVGSAELEDRVYAAIIKDGKEGVILSNGKGYGFNDKVRDFSSDHGVSLEGAKKYIVAHELVHAHGYHSESETEAVLGQYFMNMANNTTDDAKKAEYQKLANVAYKRSAAQKKTESKKAA